MQITRWVVLIGGAAVLSACGSKTEAALDCSWLASNNCWKTTAAAAVSCLPGSSETGILSPDGRTCTYSSNKMVSFDDPLILPIPDNRQWKFTITSGGQQCLRYEDTSSQGYRLTTAAGTVSQTVSGFSLSMSCPDGSLYSNSNALSLLSCGSDGGLWEFPGNFWSSSGNTVTFGILGAQGGGSIPLFNCQR
jgi:hypothetical protein